jgi:hypothetical protein
MFEENKSKFAARLIGLFFILSGIFVLIVGLFFMAAALETDFTELPKVLQNASQLELAALIYAMFFIIALVLFWVGIEILVLYGREYKQDRLGAKTVVGCLSITGLGCLLWGILALAVTSITGYVLMTAEPATIGDKLVGFSSFLVFVFIIGLIDVFVWFFYVKLSPNERENILNDYLKHIRSKISLLNKQSELMLEELLKFELLNLSKITLNVLKKLDTTRKGRLLESLYNLDLIRKTSNPNICLHGADFKRANLQRINLVEADLENINFKYADFTEADLRDANLKGANLKDANLLRANLARANLLGAKVHVKSLEKAASLENTTLPDRIKKSR